MLDENKNEMMQSIFSSTNTEYIATTVLEELIHRDNHGKDIFPKLKQFDFKMVR